MASEVTSPLGGRMRSMHFLATPHLSHCCPPRAGSWPWRRAFEWPNCRWTVHVVSSTPARHPDITAFSAVSWAPYACARLTDLRSRASAGRLCFSHVHRVVHGHCHGLKDADWATFMRWAAGTGRSGVGWTGRRVCGDQWTAEMLRERRAAVSGMIVLRSGRRMDTSGIQYCIAILLFCKYCTYCSMCNTGFWRVLHIPCNTAILMHAVGVHYVMSLFDRYVLQPATIGTGEALLAQYMSMLLMEMSFSGSSTLFTSVRASPKSGPVQVSAILRIRVCAILPFLQVLHIP